LRSPIAGRVDVLLVILLEHAQVPDRLGNGALGLGDVVCVVTNHLIEHLLRIFSRIDDRIDVGSGKLRDAPEDGLLAHVLPLVTADGTAIVRVRLDSTCQYFLISCEVRGWYDRL